MFEIDMIFAFGLFSIGLFGIASNRDFLRIFFALEMLINAVIIMLASSAHYLGFAQNITFAYMIMIIATLEAAVGILIFAAANKFSKKIIADDLLEGES